MMSSEPPSREDVAMRWQAVARGEVAREVVSKWAEPLMFAKFDPHALISQYRSHGGMCGR